MNESEIRSEVERLASNCYCAKYPRHLCEYHDGFEDGMIHALELVGHFDPEDAR